MLFSKKLHCALAISFKEQRIKSYQHIDVSFSDIFLHEFCVFIPNNFLSENESFIDLLSPLLYFVMQTSSSGKAKMYNMTH